MLVKEGPPEELSSPMAHIAALQRDLSRQFSTSEALKADCEALRTELSRCKRYSNALAVRVKELREENGTLRKMNAEMNEVIHWLDDQCEMARQRIKALEGERNGDEGNKPTSKARNQRIAKNAGQNAGTKVPSMVG